MRYLRLPLLFIVVGVIATLPAFGQRFLSDDPLWVDGDTLDGPYPAPQLGGSARGPVEVLGRTFGAFGDYSGPAQNVNTLGEVPNSSWYTNRHYWSPLSDAALRRGPNREKGPVMEGSWRVVRFLSNVPLPRAVIKDGDGRRFKMLIDSPEHPQMATGAAMISSRLLYALGYNVPQHWLRHIAPDRLAPGPQSDVTRGDVDSLLSGAYVRPDSSYRVLVTRIPDVERQIGPFSFYGTRPDDRNDIFPHEARRELRGLKVIAAWIGYSNIDYRHTMDVGVRENGGRYVRHYLVDLHLTLGSQGATRNPHWAGHEEMLELGQVAKRVGTLGFSGGEWHEGNPPKWSAVGRFDAQGFSPRDWSPRWSNPAFRESDRADAFWAAKQVRHFSDSHLKTIVETAEYASDKVDQYVVETLQRRRDSIAVAYLDWGGGLDRFSVAGETLTFDDLRSTYGLAPDTIKRAVTWHVFNNAKERLEKRLKKTVSRDKAIALPDQRPHFLRAKIRTPNVGITLVFLRRLSQERRGSTPQTDYEVVGVERMGPHDEP